MITHTVTIEVKNVYGVLKIYPVCQNAKIFARIAGTTTLTKATIEKIRELDFEIISIANADYRQAA